MTDESSYSELWQAANAIFDHLERSGHTEIEIDEDYYWSIPVEKLYAPLRDA